MMLRLFFCAAIAVSLPFAAVAASPAEATLKEVVVTATLRDTSELDVPSSMTVVDARALDAPGVQHFADVLESIPNLNWSGGTSRPRYFQLRGIGELDQYQGAPNPSVGFLIDGIDFSGVGMPATTFDVAQIEVLRGPQGTLYGANALAGLINVRSRDPSATPDLQAEISGGQHDTWSAGIAGGGPIVDGLTARVAVQRFRSDGFLHNEYLNRDDTNGRDELTARGKLHWQPGGAWQFDLATLFSDIDNGFDAFTIDNSRTMRSNQPGRDAQRSFGTSLVAKFEGSAVGMQSTSAYANSHILYSFDGDWASDAYWGVFAPYDYFSQFVRTRRTLSEDLRLFSQQGHELWNQLGWVVGAYVLNTDEQNEQADLFENVAYNTLSSQYRATNIALYGQTDWHFSKRTTLQLGMRVERRRASYKDSNDSNFDPSETMPGGHLSLLHEVATDKNTYVTVSRGYKAGGFNIGALVPAELRNFGAEYLWNFETGFKGYWLERRLRTNVALFYSHRSQQQVSRSFQPDLNDPLTYVFITENAARGENAGVETDWTVQVSEQWRVDGSLALLRTQYEEYAYVDPGCICTRDLSGRPQAHAPSNEYSLGVTWQHPSGWTAQAQLSGKGSYYFDTSHDQTSHSYKLVNVNVGYEALHWSLLLSARNVFDTDYAVRGFYFNLEPALNRAKLYTQQGDGRQVGVTLRWML